jgi:iron complex transport system ATP-binding protein
MARDIEVRNLYLPFFKPAQASLQPGMSFSLPAGKISFLLGSNGSGKSTLLKVLIGILKPTSGSVSSSIAIQGNREFSFVEQNLSNDVAYLVRDVVAMSDAAQKDIETAMHQFDVSQFANKPMNQLSGGEQRRVHLARAVAQKAQWLLMDEPTANLDIAHEIEFLRLISELASRGQSVLLSTHQPQQVQRIPKEHRGMALILQDGQLGYQGNAATEDWMTPFAGALGITPAAFYSHLSRP